MKLHRFVLGIVIAGTLAMGVGVAAACNSSGDGYHHHTWELPTTTTTAAPVIATG